MTHMSGDVVGRIVEQNLGVYRAAPSRLQEDVSQEAQVASDYRGRLVYELLQNSDDAMEGQATDDRVIFRVTDDALWMANSGRPLTDADVQGLCGLGASSKVDSSGTRRASIGHKGLGFKSVLEITEAPAIYSRTHSLTLGANRAMPHIRKLFEELGLSHPRSVPAMRFPAAISAPHADPDWVALEADGMNTAFKFPFRGKLTPDHRRTLADRLLTLPLTTVLFLKHLESVVVEVDQTGRSKRREWLIERQVRRHGEWARVSGFGGTEIYRVAVTSSDGDQAAFLVAHDDGVEIGENRVGLSGPAWEGVEMTEVSVAVLADGSADKMPKDWKHFHVFLPTAEPCPYPLLVNGAFSTDLSRQHVRVSSEAGDYNSHLVRMAAQLFVDKLLPLLCAESPERVLQVLDRGTKPSGGDAAALLHESLVATMEAVPLLPTERGEVLPLPQCALPSSLVKAEGELFREVLGEAATWDGAQFPLAPYCCGRWARVAADHGARQLSAAECFATLGQDADPLRSALRDHESGGCEIDPVLKLCALLWERADGEEREGIEACARTVTVFPVHRNDDRTIVRVALGEETAFYPPQSARKDFPLRGIRFMCHSLCWGALNKNERNSVLGDDLKVWTALFDIKEFRFQEVMQASVLPALGLNPTEEELEWRAELQSLDSVAAICQLAGAFSKPDRPLRYQRLQSDRAIFNLSRLPVPTRTAAGSEAWVPAYRVYFGSDWIGENSFEQVANAFNELSEDGNVLNAHFLAPPEQFLGLLDREKCEHEVSGEDTEGDGEVGLDEDVDRALEASEPERWLNFFSWIGVNRSLRLVHFHDVEDRDTGWLTTQELTQPQGWAFQELGETWASYRAELVSTIDALPDRDRVVPYLYELHDLDHALELVTAAEADATATVARRLFEHLVYNWKSFASMADAQVALVEKGKWPSGRSKPQRAYPDELEPVGDNLWLHRLRRSGICPTSRGPRRADVTWQRTSELERRFSSTHGRQDASDLVPVLEHDADLPNEVRALCERLGVRTEPSPSTFTIQDADHLCRQLATLYAGSTIETSALRHVLRPTYRSLFELLSGKAKSMDEPELRETPLLVESTDGLQFIPAREVLFANTSGIKERSGLSGRLPIFVLEAEPAAEAPLTSIFGCRVLERVLDWHPSPGETALDDQELRDFRSGLKNLVPSLLARIRAERSRESDRVNLIAFVDNIEPVSELELSCTLDGESVDRLSMRSYYVRPASRGVPFQGFVLWDGPAWPPAPDAAQRLAMALADTLGVNLVETFLAFVTSSDDQRRQLLDIAGATGHLQDVHDELLEAPTNLIRNVETHEAEPTAAPEAQVERQERPATGPEPRPAPASPRVPLHDFASLLIDGEPLLVTGESPSNGKDDSSRQGGSSRGGTGSARKAPAGTDLSALDALGMQIAIAYEARRLKRISDSVAVIADGEMRGGGDSLVVEVHTPAAILRAEELSDQVTSVMTDLEQAGVSRTFPGFDILSIREGEIDRLIELKSSGVDARVQAMSWNEWKSAANSLLRQYFWLYLAGNLRADIQHAVPYVRAIKDPFGTLSGETVEERHIQRAVQLRVREFETAEHLDLAVARADTE